MGPPRGFKKRRRAADKSGGGGVAGSGSGKEDVDWWDEFSKRIKGITLSRSLNKFESVFKISRKTFDYICSLVREDLTAKPASFSFNNGRLLSLDDHVAIALRRLSSGDSLLNIGSVFGLHHSTVTQVTWRFIEAMEESGVNHLRWPNTEEMETIKSKFENIRGLPNCCGAIATTHIKMCLSSMDPSSEVWIDSQDNYSMVLQVVVDPDMRIRDAITGWPGVMNNSQLLRSSCLYKVCENGMRLTGGKTTLQEGSEVREYIVGDTGFPLLPWLLTPYQGKDLPPAQHEFNTYQFATRVVAQRASAMLKEMWQIIQGEMWRPDKHKLPRIILVCCMLHNIILDLDDGVIDDIPVYQWHDPGYRNECCEFEDKDAVAQRMALSEYLYRSSH